MALVGARGNAPPGCRPRFDRAVLQHVCVSVRSKRGDDNPDSIVVCVVHVIRSGRINTDDDAHKVRKPPVQDPIAIYILFAEQLIRRCIGELAIKESLAHP
jgi:hypothetical protein